MLVVLLGVVVFQVARTALGLRAAEATADRLQEQLADGDTDGARESVADLQDQTGQAHGASDGVVFGGLSLLPWVGDDAAAVRDLAAALDQVATAAPEGVDVVERVQGEGIRTPDGAVDLDAVRRLAPPMEQLSRATQEASTTVADVDPDVLVGPLQDRARSFLDRLEGLTSGARGAAVATELLPDLLGGEGPRTYLLVVQNNAEVRSTGGLPGSIAVLRARDGRVELGFQGGAGEFQGSPGSYGRLEPGEREVFGPLLVRDFRDAGFTPDFPRAASLWLRHAESARDRTFDGVLSLDPVTLAQVLRATGPIEAAGERLDADNAVRQLLFEPYVRYEDPLRQDAFFAEAARGILDALLGAEGDEVELVRVLAEATSQRRVQFWSTEDDVERRLDGFAIAGQLPRDTGRPEVGLYLDDATQAKIQYFLRTKASLRSQGCDVDRRQRVQATWRLESQVPQPATDLPEYVTGNGDLAPRGTNRLLLRMFAPEGGELTGLEIDGETTKVSQDEVYGRTVVQKTIEIPPGESVEVVAQFLGAPGATSDPRLQWTPGIEWGASQDVATSTC